MINSNSINNNSIVQSLEALTLRPDDESDFSSPYQEQLDLRRIKVIKNVHRDDIHCIIKLCDQTFVTGSKDGSLKKWGFDGKLIKIISNIEVNQTNPLSNSNSNTIDYTKWVTAIAAVNDQYWMSGTRDGHVHLWNNSGTFLKDLKAEHAPFPGQNNPLCKNRNVHRVNCLSSYEKYVNKPFVFAGWATQFTLHSYEQCRRLKYTYTSSNDWVYAVQPINQRSLLVVTGCRLDLWGLSANYNWELKSYLIREDRTLNLRPYISAITPLMDTDSMYGLAVFDGSVRIYDLEAQKTIFHGQEHQKRVWTVENITSHCFASCADDGYIKLWDTRQPSNSICTLLDNEELSARVSVLLSLNNNQFLSGSCPDDVKKSATKAQFSFWDIRHLK